MSNGFVLLPLSGSLGGEPIILSDQTLPGTLIHHNPADSGGNDMLTDLLVGNPNPNQITLQIQIQGPGVSPQIIRVDVPPTAEGTDVKWSRIPFLLGPGFSYYMSVILQTDNKAPYLFGYVKRYPLAFESGGYGGLNQQGSLILGDGSLDTGWDTFPWTAGSVASPVNVIQDPANDRFQINRDGVWTLSVVANIEFASSNSGRRTNIRFFNETKGVATEVAPLYAGRDQEGALGVMALILDLDPTAVGDWFRIEIGGGDSFSGVTAEGADLVIMRVGDT